jgi:hypothetical protein
MEQKVVKYLVCATIAVAIAVILVVVFGGDAKAQVAVSGSASNSESSAVVTTGSSAVAQGGAVVIAANPSRTRSEVVQSGKHTVRTAPAVSAPSMGSGHPCAMSGSVGISIIGGGVSGGAMKVDEACLLAQMGQGEAALLMIARRDVSACKALRDVGRIPANSVCQRGEKRAVAAPAAQPSIPNCPLGSSWDGKGCYAKNLKAVQY